MKTVASHDFHTPLGNLAWHGEIALYASEMAGTCDDLDEQLEDAGVEHLIDSGESVNCFQNVTQ